MFKFYAPAEFKREARAGKAAGAGVLVPSLALRGVDQGSRSATFVFSDGAVDRSGDTIAAAGWQLADFRRNPVALFQHDAKSLPVGRAVNVRIDGSRLVGDIQFCPPDISAFGDRCFRMVAGGYLKAVSVGFMPLEWRWSRDPARPMGIDFLKQALLEISVVTIPANAGALLVGATAPGTAPPGPGGPSDGRAATRRRQLELVRLRHDPSL